MFTMKLFIISYDLRNQRDYQKLHDELNRFKAKPVLESTWCLNLADSNTAKIVRDHFKQFIDSDDALMVSEVNNWASYNAKNTPNDL